LCFVDICRHAADWPVELRDVTGSHPTLNGDDVIVIDSPRGYSDREVKVVRDTEVTAEVTWTHGKYSGESNSLAYFIS